jgi:hypothetical protein
MVTFRQNIQVYNRQGGCLFTTTVYHKLISYKRDNYHGLVKNRCSTQCYRIAMAAVTAVTCACCLQDTAVSGCENSKRSIPSNHIHRWLLESRMWHHTFPTNINSSVNTLLIWAFRNEVTGIGGRTLGMARRCPIIAFQLRVYRHRSIYRCVVYAGRPRMHTASTSTSFPRCQPLATTTATVHSASRSGETRALTNAAT